MARHCLSANLRKTERLITRHYDSYLEPAGVTAVQLPMLAMIHTAPEPTFRLLTEQLELDRSTLSRNLALLQRLGYIEIGASIGPKPGRIKLTAKGRKVLRLAHERWKRAHRDLMKLIDGQEVAEGLTFLKRLRGSARTARTAA
ncbi:MAG: MarR family winged helix-turn-helix transcriptional regulator [Thermoanaerobaculia bacterium]